MRKEEISSPFEKEMAAEERTTVIVIDTDPLVTTDEGGHWWDVAVPEVSERTEVLEARKAYERAISLTAQGPAKRFLERRLAALPA